MASHSPATILGVKTGTKWQLKKGGMWIASAAPSPTSCWPRSFPRHWLPQDSVNYCQCVNCRDRPKRHAGRDEIGGNRGASGFWVSTRWHFQGKLRFLRCLHRPRRHTADAHNWPFCGFLRCSENSFDCLTSAMLDYSEGFNYKGLQLALLALFMRVEHPCGFCAAWVWSQFSLMMRKKRSTRSHN